MTKKRFAAEIPEAGWYGHPDDPVKVERFWNGRIWTSRTRVIADDRVRGPVLSESPLDDEVIWTFFSDRKVPTWADLRAGDREAEIASLERRLNRRLSEYRRTLVERFFIGVAIVVTILMAYQLGSNRTSSSTVAAPVVNVGTTTPPPEIGLWTFTTPDERLSLTAGGTWRETAALFDGESRFTVGPQNNADMVTIITSAGTVADLAAAETNALDRVRDSLPSAIVNDRRVTTLEDGSPAVVLRIVSSDADASSRRLVVVAASASSIAEMTFASDTAPRYELLEPDVESHFLAARLS